MRIAHVADTHLGYKQYNLDIREKDFYDAFHQVIDICLEERVDVIVHAGDLFDNYHPPIQALLNFKEGIDKLDGKIKFLTVLGEHDIPKRKAKIPHELFKILILGKNFTLESIKIENALFAGISNLRTTNKEYLKKELKKFDKLAENSENSVLILHQAIKKYLPFKGAYQLTLDDLPKKANYYALGHIHATNVLKFGEGYLIYSGATEIKKQDEVRTWQEKGKGFYIVDIENGNVEYEFIPLDIRPQLRLELEASEVKDLQKYLEKDIKPLVNLKIFGENLDRTLIQKKLEKLMKDKVIYHKIRFSEKKTKELKISKDNYNLQAIFVEHFKNEKKGQFAKDLYDELSKGNKDSAIKLANKYFKEEFIKDDIEKN
ncbi:MAG: metallophosphoesterase [Promethearchaeota archaeon]